ncbi:Dynein heavy chain 6, axonemal [Hondaea fermentalgiana]|uniref:Dynein heavy chain 6, axonemal n=1 Tax=Hondaea fermentalgiana TaxID=2315210 RepID=A0A2R5GA86_9STRA|nr:Dynein heavy chain 6, axonemal [Hondaea fermentalgiana]|eukprot:GBG24991.1 Dynein heavy chain 6, axonemal [Hondaea fermentalgiana]
MMALLGTSIFYNATCTFMCMCNCIFLLPKAPNTERTPYDLVVVQPEDVDPEHFTMSAAGVVRIAPGEPSGFTPLSEWMRLSTTFNVISSIRFFKHYLVFKTFHLWRSSIRYNLYNLQRKKLAQRLFLAKKSFCEPLLEVNKFIADMHDVTLLDLRSQKTYEANHFADHQTQKRTHAAKELERIMEKLQHVVERVCTEATRRAKISNEAFQSSIDGSSNPREIKSRSLVALKKERADRVRALKTAMHEASMLGDFIRLADYMCVENLVKMCLRSHKNMLDELMRTSRKNGMFETAVRFTPERELQFVPDCERILALLEDLSASTVRAVGSVPRIIFIRPFKGIVAPLIVDSPDVRNLVVSSSYFNHLRRRMDAKVDADFADAQEYAATFEQLMPIFAYNQDFDFEAYKNRPELELSTIKNDMAVLSAWGKDLEKMRVGNTVGILYVESRKLRGSLHPIIERGLDRMKSLLADLAREKCGTLLEHYKLRIRELDTQPAILREFAAHVKYVQQLKDDTPEMLRNSATVEEMYRLCNTYGARVSSVDMVQFDDLKHFTETFATNRKDAEIFIASKLPEMTQTLDMNIAKLGDQLVQLRQHIQSGVLVNPDTEPKIALDDLEAVRAKLDQFTDLSKTYSQYQELFGIPVYDYKNLRETEDAYQVQFNLWTTIKTWMEKTSAWYHCDFLQLDVETLAQETQIVFKDASLANKRLANAVTQRFLDACTDFKSRVPVVLELGNPSMRPRHWEQIFTALGQPWFPSSTFTLDNLTDYDIFGKSAFVSEISGIASGEAALEASLAKIKQAWDDSRFELLPYRDAKSVYILGGLEEIFTLLEDHQVTLQTMMGSRFLQGVRTEVERWQRKLSLLADTLDEWVACQRNWMYLETIFSADDIQQQLPEEAEKFQMVDRLWKDALLRTKEEPLVIHCISRSMLQSGKGPSAPSAKPGEGKDGAALENPEDSDKLLQRFVYCNQLLDETQKSLENYLETKRSAFPRFYFLSNDELLEILSQTRDPHAVQAHLAKCFDSMKSLHFQPESEAPAASVPNLILGMTSAEGEYVKFDATIDPNGRPVESWLASVEEAMRATLYTRTKDCLKDYSTVSQISRREWIFAHVAQSVLVVDQILWTQNTAAALRDNAVANHYEFSLQQIDAMIQIVRGSLTKLERTLVGALIVLDVHARDVVNQFQKQGIASTSNFEWTRQLRYYYDVDVEDVMVRQTNTSFRYAYEYLGNTPRLVITPLTDLCYMTLTGALHLRFGGAPAGPAGTGKTETTKDLAKALAVQCVVFNCSDGLDYKIMGRFFSGLAQCGSWSCFDEFNRIDIEVLSVIAQQILTIQQGIIHDQTEIDFEGKRIPLNANFGVFITMNPGYAGRTELPDNLKALFRPVAMMVPDYRLIAEIILFSEGFSNALPLSNKMTQLYKLSSEQLSKQDHYDFGMRAVKSVLVAAGNLKRMEPDTSEDLLLIRAMRDSNVPKFLEHDLDLFKGILGDLFPGLQVPFVDYGDLQEAIEAEIVREGLSPVPSFVRKVIQVHETQLVRHGMMLVGETGSGKTTNARILAKALTSLAKRRRPDAPEDAFIQQVQRIILNPKSITAGELYGMFNDLTGEWKDGLVPHIVRSVIREESGRKWIVFDGPVDAVWIENMNTVLDDNKTLCLANSERIKIPSSVHMLFEVQDLAVASPATVSRCGMVYMQQLHIGQAARVDAWARSIGLEDMIPSQASRLCKLIKERLPAGIAFVRRECTVNIPTSEAHVLANFLKLMTSLLAFQDVVESHASLERLVNMLFVFCFAWSVGADIDGKDQARFSEYTIRELAPLLDGAGKMENVFNYFVEPSSAAFIPWSRAVPTFEYQMTTPYFDLLVPTPETTKYTYLLRLMALNKNNALIMGETGVGKSVIISQFLQRICAEEAVIPSSGAGPQDGDLQSGLLGSETISDRKPSLHRGTSLRFSRLRNNRSSEFTHAIINYSAQTHPHNVSEILEANLEKKRKTLLGPPGGKRMLLFVDDLNMPTLETYGAQPPNELLRQIIDQGGFYDTEKLFFKSVLDVNIMAACAPPGGGRSHVPARLLRHFNTLWMPQLASSSLQSIFEAILGGFLNAELPVYAELAAPLVRASITVYESVLKEMLPTPSKSHYTFNLRDLSKVVQGVLMVRAPACQDRNTLLRLWMHEEARVFRDRLLCVEDRTWFDETCADALRAFVTGLEAATPEGSEQSALVFGTLKQQDSRAYELVASSWEEVTALAGLLTDHLDEYNMTFPTRMDLVFFRDAILHVARICRVLSQPRGNALLIGVGGSGRQSLTRLATFICGYACEAIEMTRGYGPADFHESLRGILLQAGCEEKHVTFLFSDTQIAHESFLEDINNLLNSGQVPNLFEPEDREKILSAMRPIAKAKGRSEARDDLLALFTDRVREQLHVVLAFSPIGSAFRARCRKFPSLVNCCTIDWFDPWPQDALYSVARFFLIQNDRALGIEAYVDPLCQMCVHIHKSVEEASVAFQEEMGRYNYTTPTSYLELIRAYKSMLAQQREAVSQRLARYQNGLSKLKETEEVVAGLQETLTDLVPNLEKAQADTSALLERLAADQEVADAAKEVATKDEAVAQEVAAEVNKIKVECQTDLDEAMPAYESAVQALDLLDKKSIQEVKSFAQPPELVAFTMEAVCILLGVKPDWASAKKVLNDLNFLQRLIDFDKDNIDPKKIRKLAKYVNEPDFNAEKMKSVSSAACSLCMWVHAIVKYDSVCKNIAPKKAKLAEAEANLATVEKELAQKRENLSAITAKLEALQLQYDESLQNKKDIEAKAQNTEVQLERAQKLIYGLADEKVRWTELEATLQVDLKNLVGNMILATGSIAYLGPFTASFRARLAKGWAQLCRKKNIPVQNTEVSVERLLADPVAVRQWHIDGLPADRFSTENGIIATSARRWPLLIDPQGQANKWVRNTYAQRGDGGPGKDANELQVIKLSNSDFLRSLENAVRFGSPVLLENVGETLDATLEPILLKQTFKRAGQLLLRIGDSDVPYSEEFKLFITTKLPNPHYMPEVMVKVTVINFTVTLSGLEDQLLVDVVRCERPDLEQKNDELVVSIANDKRALKDIEDKILQMLANSSGNILDDEELIEELGKSKITSQAISARMDETALTTEEINAARNVYRPVAKRGSVLYFVIASLPAIDPMYQFSLQYFSKLFVLVIESAEQESDVDRRILQLLDVITAKVYANICRGLFERDKLVFSFKMAVEIWRNDGRIPEVEWRQFLVGCLEPESGSAAGTQESAADPPEYLPDKRAWVELCACDAQMPAFTGLLASMQHENDGAAWADWCEAESPHECELPGDWESQVSPFQRLLLVRALRKEKLRAATWHFVAKALGPSYADSPPFDLHGAYADSTAVTPIIFILSPGADINDYFLEIARECGKSGARTKMISLGQGQGPIAERLIVEGRETGDWVCLQNCHLAVSWLSRLEQLLEAVDPQQVHPEHRLWLTSDPSPKFPVAVLQNGIKITNEPPRGLRANMARSFADLSADEYLAGSPTWKRLLYGLVFYNALILERRKFGAVGWNIPYGWMNSDMKTAMMQLKLYLAESDSNGDEIPFQTLLTMVGDVTYGGRITDRMDQRTNRSILMQFFNPEILADGYSLVGDAEGIKSAPSSSSVHQPGVYEVKAGESLEIVQSAIANLPSTDRPPLFGLHSNADITFQQNETNEMLATLIASQVEDGEAGTSGPGDNDDLEEAETSDLQPTGQQDGMEAGAESDNEVVARLAGQILERVQRMPHLSRYDPNASPETFALLDGRVNSLGVFLHQEMTRFEHLRACVESSLQELDKATRGLVVMSAELEDMFQRLLYQRVPASWHAAGYPCLKPLGSWTNDFLARLDFCHCWLTQGPPTSYWISSFFFPQGFITSVLQMHVRKTQTPIDVLTIRTHLTAIGCGSDVNGSPSLAGVRAPKHGVYIHGLFMQGARFDAERSMAIQESFPKALFDEMPLINLAPSRTDVAEDEEEKEQAAGLGTRKEYTYSCPLYKTSLRAGTLSTTGHSTNFVIALDIPSQVDPNHWVRRGVALLTMLDD